LSELRKRIVEVFEQSDLDISDWAPRAQGELADSVLAVMDLFDVLVSALEAALADGDLFPDTELQVKEALKMARGG
jgi:hypothetical protein